MGWKIMSIILITGGNAGLGFESARRLKEVGHTVYIGSRDSSKGEIAAEQLDVYTVQMDVTDKESVENAVKVIQEKEGYLDVLINNAGISGGFFSPGETTASEMRRVYETNVFGVVQVTQEFLPLLKKSNQPVIVNVSSGLGSFGMVTNKDAIESTVNSLAYSSSKAAVSMLTLQYSKGLPANFKVNAVDPGPTKTGLTGFGNQTVEEGTDAIVAMATIGPNGPTGTFVNRKGKILW